MSRKKDAMADTVSGPTEAGTLILSERDSLRVLDLAGNPPEPPDRPTRAAKHWLAGSALVSAFEAMPHHDIEIELTRSPMPVRDIDL
jgi:hypothetical protein